MSKGDKMKIKKIATKILIGVCFVSIVALFVIIFTGCSSEIEKIEGTLSAYTMDIDFDDNTKSLTCSENVSYINSTNTALNHICFHLYPNAFRDGAKASVVSLSDYLKAYPNGKSYGNIEIKNVSVLNSIATCTNSFSIEQPTYSEISKYINSNKLNENQYFVGGEDENILYVILKTPLYPDERIDIKIEFNVTLPNINHRFGYGNNTVNIANFYPIACVFNNGDFDKSLYNSNGDPFYSDMSNYLVNLKIPKNYLVANTGNVISKEDFEDRQLLNIEANVVRDFAIVMSKEFNILSETIGKTEVKYYYFDDENSSLSLETATKALSFFSDYIGNYPYSTLSVVETNFVHGGMEFPNLVYVSNDVSNVDSYQQVIIHEIAHQWWYSMVGNSAYNYGWLDEGLTEYSTILFYDHHPEYKVNKDTLISNAYSSYNLFISLSEKVNGEVDTSMSRALCDYNTEQEYVYVAYVKGMLLFDSLREIVGAKKFQKCLQNYFDEYKFQNVTPDNLIASFEKTTKTDLKNYFDSWIEGKVVLLK